MAAILSQPLRVKVIQVACFWNTSVYVMERNKKYQLREFSISPVNLWYIVVSFVQTVKT